MIYFIRLCLFPILWITTFVVASAAEDFRTWKTLSGGYFEAKLESVAATTVRLVNQEGQAVDFPLPDLMPSDQKYVREWSMQQVADSNVSGSNAERSAFAEKVYEDLVHAKGKGLTEFKPEAGENPKYFAFYRSAAWCPPCRSFTPKLVSFYNKQKRKGAAFELIFISSDRSEDAMAKYMSDYKMPWPAFRYGQNKDIVSPNGGGIPNLLVTDAEGKKLLDSYSSSGQYIGPTAVMLELEKLLSQ